MLKNKMRGVPIQLLQIGLAVALLCGSAAAQRSAPQLSPEAYYNHGVAKMKSLQFEDAVKEFDQAMRLNPHVAKFYLDRGRCFFVLHRVYKMPSAKSKAIADLNKAIELQADLVPAYTLRAKLYTNRFEDDENYVEDNKKALADFSKAIELKPEDDRLYRERAWFYSVMFNYQGMIDDYTVILRFNPGDTSALFVRSIAYKAIEKYDLAIADYTALLKYEPNTLNYLNSRARIYYKINKFDLAIADYSQIIKLNPKDTVTLLDRANCFAAIGKYEQAISDCTEAIRLKSQDYLAHWYRAEYYTMVNKYEEAIVDFTVALKSDPKIPDVNVLKKRAALYRKLNKIFEAEADEAAVKRIEESAKK